LGTPREGGSVNTWAKVAVLAALVVTLVIVRRRRKPAVLRVDRAPSGACRRNGTEAVP
jgi:hypothetical protein